MKIKRRAIFFVPLFFAIIGFTTVYFVFFSHKPTGLNSKTEQSFDKSLPTVGSVENLKKLAGEFEKQQEKVYNNRGLLDSFSIKGESKTSNAKSENSSMQKSESLSGGTQSANIADSNNSSKSTDSHSETNTQVEGVDESDIIKNDGTYIYHVNKSKLIITKAYPVEEMKTVYSIDYTNGNQPLEIYLDSDYLTVIGTKQSNIDVTPKITPKSKNNNFPSYSTNVVYVEVYDIKDKSNIKKLRNYEVEGAYVSSRKIGTNLHIISNKYLYLDYLNLKTSVDKKQYSESEIKAYNDCTLVPFFNDNGSDYEQINFNNVRYSPDSIEPNFITISSLDISTLDKKANVNSYLGAGDKVYASTKNLYISVNKYESIPSNAVKDLLKGSKYESKSLIYKFSLDGTNVKYKATAKVPGSILNQFSMDENNDYFRLATTQDDFNQNSGTPSLKNNLYVLDKNLKISGKIENIAPGEKIYSARFLDDRAYIVTFKKVDPLFVIDLKNPNSPQILGKLKIPGYSDYLHPYDQNHIIGFGKDTIENDMGVYYQGLKMALFDVSDVKNPKQKFSEVIGSRGTDSELLKNHKALLFSKDKNLLAFPIMIFGTPEYSDKSNSQNSSSKNEFQYSEFSFQGALIYNIDKDTGFKLKEKITHIDANTKPITNIYENDSSISRIIYIKNVLYTISNNTYKAHDISTMKELKSVSIK